MPTLKIQNSDTATTLITDVRLVSDLTNRIEDIKVSRYATSKDIAFAGSVGEFMHRTKGYTAKQYHAIKSIEDRIERYDGRGGDEYGFSGGDCDSMSKQFDVF
jgi:hypothetical protein